MHTCRLHLLQYTRIAARVRCDWAQLTHLLVGMLPVTCCGCGQTVGRPILPVDSASYNGSYICVPSHQEVYSTHLSSSMVPGVNAHYLHVLMMIAVTALISS